MFTAAAPAVFELRIEELFGLLLASWTIHFLLWPMDVDSPCFYAGATVFYVIVVVVVIVTWLPPLLAAAEVDAWRAAVAAL